jgi:DNA mismatch repair protein MutS
MQRGEATFGVFDEIFSGTNVTDAIACASLLIEQVSKAPNCLLFVSSHNLQLAGSGNQPHVQFNYIEALAQDDIPVFTYKLRQGKSSVGLGEKLFRSALAMRYANDDVAGGKAK